MELYMMNRPHGQMILASVEKGPLVWPTIIVDGATRPKEYTELTAAETIQADCDIKAINIILQGIPPEIYALVSQHRVAKDIWEKIELLMQGTSLTKKERDYLHTTNVEQIHAHLEQHERHDNEVRLMHERNSDPLALVASHQMTQFLINLISTLTRILNINNKFHHNHIVQYEALLSLKQHSVKSIINTLSITYFQHYSISSVHHNIIFSH
ncbi:hypothetical protein Tco_0337435 [Tanacetum coccineum]